LKKSIERSLETDNSFFIHPNILKAIKIENSEQYYISDKEGNTILNTEKIKEYREIIRTNLDTITQQARLGEKGLLQTDIIISMIGEGKKKQDIASYLLT